LTERKETRHVVFQRESKEEVSYDEKGQIKEKKVSLDGKLHGEYTSYFGNGQIMTRLFFANGHREGGAVSYLKTVSSGKKALTKKTPLTVNIPAFMTMARPGNRNTTKTANWTANILLYYRSGQIKDEENYRDGKLDGEYRSFFKKRPVQRKRVFQRGPA